VPGICKASIHQKIEPGSQESGLIPGNEMSFACLRNQPLSGSLKHDAKNLI